MCGGGGGGGQPVAVEGTWIVLNMLLETPGK